MFTNADGIVYHYFIEGTSMKDGSRVPPEVGALFDTQSSFYCFL